MIVGITGGSGSGKTTALRVIEKMGGLVLDCDAIYHRLLEEDTKLLQAIDEAFPNTVENGKLNREKLAKWVFSDASALEKLNQITHTAVKQQVLQQLKNPPALVAIDAIELFTSGLAELCDVTVAVIAPEKHRLKRLVERDAITEQAVQRRLAAQHTDSWFARHCDHILENNGTLEEFQKECLAFFTGLGIM